MPYISWTGHLMDNPAHVIDADRYDLVVVNDGSDGNPVKVTIDAGDVGGPSAGMMFALGVLDRLTPGELTAGQRIAGTGTISSDGRVGPIGGIQQKLAGARAAGIQWFLAPAGNCSEVVGHVPAGLTVVRVEDFDDALADVRAIAAGNGSALQGCG